MKSIGCACLVLVLSIVASSSARADDSDIFYRSEVKPNVVILIDTSGSMSSTIGGVAKITIAKNVVTSLLQNVEGVNFGIFKYKEPGGQLVSPIGTAKSDMIAAVAALTAAGNTPLGGATQDIQDYYMGLYSGGVGAADTDSSGGDEDEDESEDEDEGDEDEDTDSDGLPSPIEFECQKNYAILMTDGMPTGEDTNLVKTVASSMYTTDHSTSLAGMQNVIVHTIGFDVPAGTALLTQTAANGGGTFYTASTAAQLEVALRNAVLTAIEATYSFAAPLVPSTSVTGGTKAYVGSFQPSPGKPFWNGWLRAYTRGADGQIPLVDGKPSEAAIAWDAGDLLALRTPASRTIYTSVGSNRQAFTTSNAALTTALMGASSSTDKNNIINFVRGIDAFDDNKNGNTTEERSHKLGDVFHSAPVLVFPPRRVSTDEDYVDFKEAHANRTAIVLVGANDGMLHAFRETDGSELWGFIPNPLLDDLKKLTGALGAHPYFVDSGPMVADVEINGNWKTIAVFGLRRGGGSYHALDITDTENPVFLWNFTDSEIVESWSEPSIGKIRMSGGTEKWVAFIGGGYNTASNNANGRGIFAIDLASGTKLWQYKYAATGDAQYMNFSVPASPKIIDLDGDGLIDRVWVGDVGGQLWKFDVSAAATTSAGLVDNWPGKRMFTAAPTATNPPAAGEYYATQAIYGRPALSYDAHGDLWVYFGTGDRNHPNQTSSNLFFGLKDNVGMTNGSPLTKTHLTDSTSGATPTQGWYFDLPADEKALSSATIYDGVVYFTTYATVVESDACADPDGTAHLYAVNMANGHAGLDFDAAEKPTSTNGSEDRSVDVGGGIPSDPLILMGSSTDRVLTSTTDEEVDEQTIPRVRRKDLRYWREVR